MLKLIFNWVIYTLAILITAYLLPGVHIAGIFAALVLAVVLGLINTFVRPVLLILTLPITIFTLGIFVLILNALLILLAAAVVPGFSVDGFWWALAFSLVLWLVQAILKGLEREV
jgi:putative membrane protein